jgi:queuine tRNA-ribosyltransferase
MLMTEHNINFYQQLMAGLRAAIAERRLSAFSDDFRRSYGGGRHGTAGF